MLCGCVNHCVFDTVRPTERLYVCLQGIMHTTAGFMLMSSMTFDKVFDYQDGDIYACVADVGWITGHSYIGG